jgi:TRAF-type zinc finger
MHNTLQCPGCEAVVSIKKLHRHSTERCVNRRVRCKHWELGCTARVRAKDMARHLMTVGTTVVAADGSSSSSADVFAER